MGKSKGKVLETVVQIAGEISPTLGKTLGGVMDQLDGVNVKALAAGAATAGIVIAVGKAALEAGKYLGALGGEYNSAVNDISAATGLVGDELENMQNVLKDVYSSNFGESMEDAAAGITEVYRATGLTDEALAETTKAAYTLSDVFGYDVAESARAAKAMMTNFGIEGEEAMELIAAGAQNGLDYSGELIDSINEYSVQFAKLGFSADDMFNIFQQGADSGAWNLDKVGDAVKEFSIRSIDGSKTTIHAFESLGLNADEMMATFAAGGDEASLAFQGVLTALMSMDDQVQRDALGVEIFGTQWEDLGTDAMAALADVSNSAYSTGDTIDQMDSARFNNLGDAIEAIKRQMEVALLPLAETVAGAFLELAPAIGDAFTEIGPYISDAVSVLSPLVGDFLGQAVGLIKQLLPYIVKIAGDLFPIIVEVIGEILTATEPLQGILLDLVIQLLPLIVSLIRVLLPVVVMLLEAFAPIIGLVAELITILLPPLVNLITFLTPLIEAWANAIGTYLGGAISAISPLLSGIMGILGNLIDFIVNIFSGNWADAWTSIVDVFKGIINLLPQIVETVINALIATINGILTGINDIGGKFGIEIPLIPTVTLPKFAAGGFTDGFSIAGEDPQYPVEAVISFNPAYRDENLSYWAQAGRMLGADASDFFLGGGSGSSTVIDMGGVTFAPNITITGTADKKTIMQAIEEEYPEFLDMLEEFLIERGQMVYA